MRGAVLALSLGLMVSAVSAVPGLEPGVSRELARWRAQHYRDVRYALAIHIAAGATKLEGTATIEVTLPGSTPDVVLDWRPLPVGARVRELNVNGRRAQAKLEREHLIVPAHLLRAGRNRVLLRFESPIAASGSAVTRYTDRADGSEYVYTLLVPSDASSVFPCFDQPDLKGRFSLELTVPRGWTAVANASVAATEDAPNDMRRHRFAQTLPISTYLFAFAAGPFAELTEAAGPTRLLVRKSRLARAREEAPEVLRLNREAMQWFARYFAFRFPFPKYALVLVPELAYGGMEHAGSSFLREDAVLFPSAPNETDILARAQLIFHETSHMWFGDLVTMRWFDDLWLKEGFATYMAAKALADLDSASGAWKTFYLSNKPAAYGVDQSAGTTSLWQSLANLDQAKSTYVAIVYNTAPAVWKRLNYLVDEPAFQKGVQAVLAAHAYEKATWRELLASMSRAAYRPLDDWGRHFMLRRGM